MTHIIGNHLTRPVGLRSTWDGSETTIYRVETTPNGTNLALSVGYSAFDEEGYHKVAHVTLTPEDAQRLRDVLDVHLEMQSPAPVTFTPMTMEPHAEDPLSPCPDCGQEVPTIYTGHGYSGAPRCPQTTSQHMRGHRVTRDALDTATREASREVREHYCLPVLPEVSL